MQGSKFFLSTMIFLKLITQSIFNSLAVVSIVDFVGQSLIDFKIGRFNWSELA